MLTVFNRKCDLQIRNRHIFISSGKGNYVETSPKKKRKPIYIKKINNTKQNVCNKMICRSFNIHCVQSSTNDINLDFKWNKSEHGDAVTLLTTFNNYAYDKIHLKTINLITIITSWIAYKFKAAQLFYLAGELITFFSICGGAIARELHTAYSSIGIIGYSKREKKNVTKLSMNLKFIYSHFLMVNSFAFSSSCVCVSTYVLLKLSFTHETNYTKKH